MKPWNKHSSTWEKPWDERPEQRNFEVNPPWFVTAAIATTFWGGFGYAVIKLLESMSR